MAFGDEFDDEKTIFIDLQSERGEENLLFFLEDNPENKIFLKSGEAVTVGRSSESDFLLENKTVSRKHLTIKRDGRGVNIKIHGRNGLYMDNELFTGPLLKINPPVSFTIGDVLCSLEFEVDDDKTIIVTADQRTGMKNTVRPQVQPCVSPSPTPEPETKKPFDPSPNDTFIPSHASELGGRSSNLADFRSPDQRKQEYTAPPEPPFEQSQGMGQARFEPVPKTKDILLDERQGFFNGFAANKSNVIIAGIIAFSVLIIIFIFFVLFTGRPDKNVTPSDVSSQKVLEQASPAASDGAPDDSHKVFLDLANELIKSGDTVTARDVLSDIPEDSPYYSRAKKLLAKLPEN